MIRSYKKYACFLALAALFSCKKASHWLDKPDSGDITKERVFAETRYTEQFLANIYNVMFNNHGRIHTGVTYNLALATDEGNPTGYAWRGDKFNAMAWVPADWSSSEKTPFNDNWWNFYFSYNRKINVFLENYQNAKPVDGFSGPRYELPIMRGQALFLRAFLYSDLLRLFGPVPVITKNFGLSDNLIVPRNTYAECIKQIMADCDEAASLLPPRWDDADLGRATKGAALALKARMMLYAVSYNTFHNGNVKGGTDVKNDITWQQAADAAKLVAEDPLYELYKGANTAGTPERIFNANYNEIFWKGPASNKEIICYRSNGTGRFLEGGYWANGPLKGAAYVTPTGNLINAYEMQATGKPITDNTSGYDVAKPYTGRDPRFYASIIFNGAKMLASAEAQIQTYSGGNAGIVASGSTSNTRTGFYLRKFAPDNASLTYTHSQYYIYMRLAEVYLNYAEALNEAQGPVADVYKYINLIRRRASMPDLPAGLGKEQMRERIRNERMVELAFEEHRYFDVRRWNIAEQVEKEIITHKWTAFTSYAMEKIMRPWNDKSYWLPIPQSEIDKTNRVITQNKGW